MDNNPNKEPNQEQNKEELEELREVIKKLEEMQKQKNQKKPPRRPFIAIEFGGVFHHNRVVNFVFSYIVNLAFAYFVIEIFQFANYNDILYLALLMFGYTIAEEVFRTYVLIRHLGLIMKSFGTIFYFGYLMIFFVLDQYVFIQSFNFINGTLLAFFVLFFTLARYTFGTFLRGYFRKKEMR